MSRRKLISLKGIQAKKDCSQIIELLPKHEERAGVTLKGVYAAADKDEDGWLISVKCEAHSLEGDELGHPVEIVASLLDAAGRVIENSSHYISEEDFFEFEVVDLSFFDVSEMPSKIRLHPKKA